MNKLFTKIATLIAGLSMAIGVGVAVANSGKVAVPVHAAEEVFYELSPVAGSNNSYAGNCDVECDGITWNVNGNAQMVPWRLGGKSISNTNRTVYSKTSIGAVITKIELTTGDASSCTVNSIKLEVGNSGFSSITDTVTKSSSLVNTTITYSPNSGKTWASGSYYRFTFNVTVSGKSNKYVGFVGAKFYYNASTPLAGITLGGAASSNAMSIESSDLTAKTVSVTLNPSGATDQKVNIAHQSGTSGLFTVSSSATCTSGSGSFTVTGKGNTSGTETFRISGNTETSVYVDLVVTALDDSVTYWTVSFDSDGGASITDMSVEDGDTFEFPSPGTKTHYSFDGWSSDGGNTLYDAGDESPAVDDDIEYTAYWTEDSKYTVTYVHGDHGTGENYVVNNVYGGSYTLATFATAGFEASSGYSFKKWSVGGVEYAEGASITVTAATTVTAIYKTVDEFTLFSGTLVEGDYVICSGTKAMKNETTSAPRIDVADVTVTNNKIVDPDASIIWHIAQDGDYWTIYNAAVEKYAAFTSTNGRGTLIDSVTDYARFSTEDSYEFINVGNSGKYLRYNPTYGFASYSTSTGVSLTLYKAPSNELSSIALSGDYKTSFASGETFSFGGTVTASYTLDEPATVTSSTTFHLDSANGTNMSGVTMTHAAHDGHTIYAKYTEGGITKTATYSISVANAPVSSLTIASNTGKVALNEYFDMSEIGVTILPADAVQTYEWTVLSNTVNDDYGFDADVVAAKDTAGTITLKCTSTADSSKYQTFVLTVSGNPVVTLPDSVTLYTGKTTTVTASVEGGTSPYSYSWSITSGGSYASISSGGSSATVALSGTAAGSVTLQCSVTDSNSKSDSASVTFSVIASAVTSVNWSASAFDVFSGATIPADIDDTWEVNYEKNNGDADYITFGTYKLYLGAEEITSLPYTFVAADDGKELYVEYGGVSSAATTVKVTQTINDINANLTSAWDYTFSAKAWSEAGDYTLNEKLWTMSGTDDGTPYFGYDATKGQQFGSGSHPYSDISLQSSAFSGTIDSVTVYTSGANSINATVQVSVGGTAYGSAQTITNTNTAYTFDLGGKSGTISIDYINSSSKAIYVKEIIVNTASGTQNIANSNDHKDAQRIAVAFANAFNAAMDKTENCTTGLATAWSTCTSAYNTFKSQAAALGETEEAYAKNLIKYASAQYSDDSGEACIERMLETYKRCVQKYGQNAFMAEIVTLGRSTNINPIAISSNTNTAAVIIIVSVISAAAIGGYFFLRKRKEEC